MFDQGGNISCNIDRVRLSVDGERFPSFRTKRSVIDRTNLIKNDVTCPALEAAGYAERIGVASGRECYSILKLVNR